MAYKRVLLKLSGELLGSENHEQSINFDRVNELVSVLRDLAAMKTEVGIVVGAGNIFRARMVEDGSVDRVAADHMGMMATIINALALQAACAKSGLEARVLSAISMPEIVEDYVHKRAIKHMQLGRPVIFAAGTGRPYFTTDTAAVERALEVKADIVLKATNVDGVYDDDPKKNPSAKKFDTLTFTDALDKGLRVMDSTAFALAQENKLRILVFKFSHQNVVDAVAGKQIGTLVTG